MDYKGPKFALHKYMAETLKYDSYYVLDKLEQSITHNNQVILDISSHKDDLKLDLVPLNLKLLISQNIKIADSLGIKLVFVL